MSAIKIKTAVLGTRGFPGVQGGVEAHCEKLYPRLAGLGCDVTVFTRRGYTDPKISTYKGVKLISLYGPKNKFIEAFLHTFFGIFTAAGIKPDIIHIHAIGPSLFVPLARLLGFKVVMTNHGPDYKRKKWGFFAKSVLKIGEMLGSYFANEIICVSDNIASDIRKKYGRNAHAIPNGIEIPDILTSDNILKTYSLEKGKYVLAVGRLVPEKGFDYLIDAFNEIDKWKLENGEWKLVLVGTADHEDRYSRHLRDKAKSSANIVMTGFLSGRPLEELYSHAGLFVMPSYYEGLPIVLLEAMSYGLSCIASDIPANKEIGLPEDRYFKCGNISGLSEKMSKYLSRPMTEEDRQKQIHLIAKNYNWDTIAQKTFTIYNYITGR